MNSKFVLGTGLAALLVVGAPFVALAHENTQANANAGFQLGSVFNGSLGAALHLDGNKGNDNDGDRDDGHATSSTAVRPNVAAGTVTSVNGSTFTVAGLFGGNTTTVTTDSNTVFKAKGGATSSVAINVGSRVFVVGTTTATSTTGDTIAASLVRIIANGFGHLRFWLWFGHH